VNFIIWVSVSSLPVTLKFIEIILGMLSSLCQFSYWFLLCDVISTCLFTLLIFRILASSLIFLNLYKECFCKKELFPFFFLSLFFFPFCCISLSCSLSYHKRCSGESVIEDIKIDYKISLSIISDKFIKTHWKIIFLTREDIKDKIREGWS
jgi:hypothetical protein